MTSFNIPSQILALGSLISSRRSFCNERVLLIKFKQDVLIEASGVSQVLARLKI